MPSSPGRAASPRQTRTRPGWHVHWFRRLGDDAFSGAALYACRCGEVRPGF